MTDDTTSQAVGAAPVPRLLWPGDRWARIAALAALLAAALRVAIIPLFVTPVFDRVLTGGDLTALPRVMITSGIAVVLGAAALWVQDAGFGRSAAETVARWRAMLAARLLAAPPGTLPGSSGALAGRIVADLREVELFIQFALGSWLAESATALGIVGVLLWQNTLAATALLVLSMPTLLVLRALGGRVKRASDTTQRGLEALGGALQEAFSHHELVRAERADAFFAARVEAPNRATQRASTRRSALAALQTPTAQLLVFAAVGLLVVLLSQSVTEARMSAGEVIAFITLAALLSTPAQLLPRAYAMRQTAAAAARRLEALDPGAPTPARPPVGAPASDRLDAPLLELRDVAFGYREAVVLEGIDLKLEGPAFVAIVGESGVGKTTLLRLLLGFVAPTHGSVTVQGGIGYVPQGHRLLSGSVRDNLALGRDIADAALWRALDAVGMRATIAGHPLGLERHLAEDGAGLSGGERQRLALARALLGDPRILLLDEPSASLDATSERELVTLLQRHAATRLVVAISHRPALAEGAQRIYRLRDRQLRPLDGGEAIPR